jgi:hypothetical protein
LSSGKAFSKWARAAALSPPIRGQRAEGEERRGIGGALADRRLVRADGVVVAPVLFVHPRQRDLRRPRIRGAIRRALLELGDEPLQVAVPLAIELGEALHGERRRRLSEGDRRVASDQRVLARTAPRGAASSGAPAAGFGGFGAPGAGFGGFGFFLPRPVGSKSARAGVAMETAATGTRAESHRAKSQERTKEG